MPHNGLIYAVLGDSNIWNKAPLVSEIKSRSGPGGLLPVASRVLTYVKTSAASGSLSFTGLDPDFTYTLYLLASDDNPFDTANLGEIKSYKIVLEMAYESLCTILALLFLFTLFV